MTKIEDLLEECVARMNEECGLCAVGYTTIWDEKKLTLVHDHPGSGFIDECSAPVEVQLKYLELLTKVLVFDKVD